jgi:RNA polymerase sigma-B factor
MSDHAPAPDRQQLIADHVGLAADLAARYHRRGAEPDDLFQVACVGLVAAVDRFDPSRGVPFTAFAVPTILGELRRYFRDHHWRVHVPRRLRELSQRIQLATEALRQEHGSEPTLTQLADALELPLDDVIQAVAARSAHRTVSLERWLTDVPPDPAADLDMVDVLDAAHRAIAALPERDREILKLRYSSDLSQAEIGERVGISQMQVSRLLTRSLTTLRSALSDDHVERQT